MGMNSGRQPRRRRPPSIDRMKKRMNSQTTGGIPRLDRRDDVPCGGTIC
jgi:hypothetical protein